MNLQVAKWGNSVALRIPAEFVRRLGIKEGDQVQVNLTADAGICIHAAKWDRKSFVQELEETREAMPMTDSVMEEVRRGARY